MIFITASIFLVKASEIKDCRNDCTNEKKVNSENCSFAYLFCKEDCNKALDKKDPAGAFAPAGSFLYLST